MSEHLNDEPEIPENDELLDLIKGNRPADGARQSTPGEVFSENFHGADTAGDFLGLDVDMESMYAAGADDEELALSSVNPVEDGDPSAVWDQEEQDEQDAQSLQELDDLDPSNVLPGDPGGYAAESAHAWQDDEDLAVEELDDEDYEYEDEEQSVASSAGRKLALVAIPFVVGVVAVAGVVLVPRMLEGDPALPATSTRVATVTPKQVPTDEPEVDLVATGETPENEAEIIDGTEDPLDPEPETIEDPLEVATGPLPEIDPQDEGEPFGLEGVDPGTARPGLDELIGNLVGEANGKPRGTGERVPMPGNGTAQTNTNAQSGSVAPDAVWRDSSDSQWDVIWQGGAVPMEAIAASQQVLTPRVGGVRVHMRSGEVFDGKLYAVGLNRVWIDSRPGRVGLDGERVVKIDRLTAEAVADSNGKQVATGDRVKIRLPGGHLFGRILAEAEDGSLTVQTDAGGRVTLAKAEVEAVGRSRVRVIE